MTATLVCGTKRESVPERVAELGFDVWNPHSVKILGTPVGSGDFVARLATERLAEEQKNVGSSGLGPRFAMRVASAFGGVPDRDATTSHAQCHPPRQALTQLVTTVA